MFSSIVRFGIALSGAALLSSCGGSNGQALTQQSTPEGLFTGQVTVPVTTSASTTPVSLTENAVVFVEVTGAYYAFYMDSLAPTVLAGATAGTFSFGGGGMTSSGTLNITPPVSLPISASGTPPVQVGIATAPSFGGAYNTGMNIAGTFTFPTTAATITFNLPYNADYQNAQNLSTLAGTYTGTVASSTASESATFTFGTASVLANSANQFGVATVTGTGADGCIYTGTVSPLYKGNGYNLSISSGNAPCTLPNTQFTGLVYLDVANNFLYSFSPNAARSDGLIFTGSRL
jgi:hypothetical protein